MARSSALLLALVLSALLAADHSVGQLSQVRMREARQCRIQRISSSHPSRRVESEGGVTELWDDREEQFQCAGLSAMRNTIQPECMSLPNYSPSTRLVYIQRGQGLMGISYPGCPETFHSGEQPFSGRTEEGEQVTPREQHQKVHRVQEGDLLSIPAGAAHWCYNDGNQELVAFSVTDLNSLSNQLDPADKSFFLAGGRPKRPYEREGQEEPSRMVNILQAFDANLIAESFGIPMDLARRMQREDERGIIVRVRKGGMRVIRPTSMEEEREQEGRRRPSPNGMEETLCNMRVRHYLDNPQEADVYSRQAGRLYSVNMHKLPILQYIGMSAEKGNLRSNVIFGPHWSTNAHTLIYITRGRGRTQIVSGQGRPLFDQNVKQGDVFIIPQFFASMHRSGDDGIEWVAFKTSPMPMRSPMAGRTSVFRGMPMEVITNAYRIPYSQARELKYSREDQMMMFTPRRSTRT